MRTLFAAYCAPGNSVYMTSRRQPFHTRLFARSHGPSRWNQCSGPRIYIILAALPIQSFGKCELPHSDFASAWSPSLLSRMHLPPIANGRRGHYPRPAAKTRFARLDNTPPPVSPSPQYPWINCSRTQTTMSDLFYQCRHSENRRRRGICHRRIQRRDGPRRQPGRAGRRNDPGRSPGRPGPADPALRDNQTEKPGDSC
jgi:hypothetical protein